MLTNAASALLTTPVAARSEEAMAASQPEAVMRRRRTRTIAGASHRIQITMIAPRLSPVGSQ